MNNGRSNIIFIQAAFLISCLFFLGCENDPLEVIGPANNRPLLEEATNVQSLLSQDGNPRAFLKAPFMLRYNADTSFIEFPKSLHVDLYDSSGRVESQVNALYGKYFESRSKVYLRDSVIVFNVKGDTLRSPDLWWDQSTRKFYTDKVVRLKTKDKQIYGGKGLEAEQDLSRWTIFKPTGFVLVPDSLKVE